MHIRCPHCRNQIELVEESSPQEISCMHCGSRISLAAVDETLSFRRHKSTDEADGRNRFGRFELLRKVGMGAFGTVWQARDPELDRVVAVKIPRGRGMSTDEVDLFLREARAAAQLKHPHIVAVHEVGREDGALYIVSDFIEGESLEQRIANDRPTQHEAAQLCATLAEALHHAHQNGVVHRDLKPANVMLDRKGHPYVMDFGLAKREAGEVTMTVEGHLLGTPAYMAPEQARGDAHQADARSDVYSLGVILFELLTGERPFRGNIRILLEQVLHDDAPSPRKLNDRLDRDLETICLKCLEKDPTARYQSAAELAHELRRFLRGEPIRARAITRVNRVWRWCRRNPVVATLMGIVTGLLLVLAVGGPLVALQQHSLATLEEEVASQATETLKLETEARKAAEDAQKRVETQRQKAEAARKEAERFGNQAIAEARSARQISEFMVGLFHRSDPGGLSTSRVAMLDTRSADMTAREILDRGATKITEELAEQPVVQARLMATIGDVYVQLGMLPSGEELLLRALELRRKHLGIEHLDYAESLNQIGILRMLQGRSDESERLFRDALKLRLDLLGEDHPETLNTQFLMVWPIIEGRRRWKGDKAFLTEGELLLQQVIEGRRNQPDAAHDVANAELMLASLYGYHRKYTKAIVLVTRANARYARLGVKEHAGQIITDVVQATVALTVLDDREAFETSFMKAITKSRRILGAQHPVTLLVQRMGVREFRDLDKAERILREAVDIGTQSMGRQPRVAFSMLDLARVLIKQNKLDEAKRQLQEAREICTDVLGSDHWMTGLMWYTLAYVWSMEEDFSESERCYRNALATFRKAEVVSYRFLGHRCLEGLERVLRAQQKTADADAIQQERTRLFGR